MISGRAFNDTPPRYWEKEILEQFLLHNNIHPEHLAEDGDHLSNEGVQIYK